MEPHCVKQVLHIISAIRIAYPKFLLVLRLHAGIDLRDQVDCVSNTVNNHTGVGLAIAKVHRRVFGVVGSSKSPPTKIKNNFMEKSGHLVPIT